MRLEVRFAVALLLSLAAACARSPYRRAAAPFAVATERAAITLPATLQIAGELCHRRDELDRLQRLLEGRDASDREALIEFCDELTAAGEVQLVSLVLLQEYGRGLSSLASETRYTAPDFASVLPTKLGALLVGGWADSTIEQAVLRANAPVQELLTDLAKYGDALSLALREHRATLRELDDLVISRQARGAEPPSLDRAFSIAERFATWESETASWERELSRYRATISALIDAQQALASAAERPEDAAMVDQLAGRAAAVQAQLRLLAIGDEVAGGW